MAAEASHPAEHPAEASPDLGSEEDEKQNLEASSVNEGDSGIPASAPDVTYDATVLENEHCPERGKDCAENGDGSGMETATTKEKVEEAVQLGQRTEGDGREEGEEGKGGQSENDDEEWMDILGSGALKKKVRTLKEFCMILIWGNILMVV